MDHFITAAAIRTLREEQGLTQRELAERLDISDKTVSKWETAKGLPDITLMEPLARALNVSLAELMAGQRITNRNVSCNLLRTRFHVCPICGNILHATGDALISCCGSTLPPLKPAEADDSHHFSLELVEDEFFFTIPHEMSKEHFISFAAYVTDSKVELLKLYPEGNAEGRFHLRGNGWLYAYCNRHGLTRQRV